MKYIFPAYSFNKYIIPFPNNEYKYITIIGDGHLKNIDNNKWNIWRKQITDTITIPNYILGKLQSDKYLRVWVEGPYNENILDINFKDLISVNRLKHIINTENIEGLYSRINGIDFRRYWISKIQNRLYSSNYNTITSDEHIYMYNVFKHELNKLVYYMKNHINKNLNDPINIIFTKSLKLLETESQKYCNIIKNINNINININHIRYFWAILNDIVCVYILTRNMKAVNNIIIIGENHAINFKKILCNIKLI